MLRARDKMKRAWYGNREEKRERDRDIESEREINMTDGIKRNVICYI